MAENSNAEVERRFLTLKEVCKYTGWGLTKTREIIKRKDSTFTVKICNKYFIDKKKFDSYLENCMRYRITI